MHWKGLEWLRTRLVPVLGKVQLIALLLTLLVMFAGKREVILNQPMLIVKMAAPLVLFFFTLFNVGYWLSRSLRLDRDKAVTVAFHVTGRNFELSIALALSAFASIPLVAVSTVVGPLIEIPTMLALVWWTRHLQAARREKATMTTA
jgi:ACR3 family arsenite transporter